MKINKLGVLFSGGKDSTLAALIAKKEGYTLSCLISLFSQNPYSYMFHTPSITQTIKQAESMQIPLIVKKTKGEKEEELKDLREALLQAKRKYSIEGVVSGAVNSVYQTIRIRRICYELRLKCFNPLWLMDQTKLLESLIEEKIKAIIVGVAAYPLGKEWLGKTINKTTIERLKQLQRRYKINPAGEGGEFETLVLNSPLFKYPLRIKDKKVMGRKNTWRMEVTLE